MRKEIAILGTRGVPASHGGFETFAEHLSLYLLKKGWKVTVFCQKENGSIERDTWHGVTRIIVPAKGRGALASVSFDLKVAWLARKQKGVLLTLGYNTAVFNVIQRFWQQKNIINMDGIEWKRDKWGAVAKLWFWMNERIGCMVGNHLIADHPQIKKHLSTRVYSKKITMIPYGGDYIESADVKLIGKYGISPNKYSVVIARPEPENSFLEIVEAFSSKKRNHNLVILGNFDYERNGYHKKVIDAASDEVLFLGAIYESNIVSALRYFSAFYIHGHTVGGTNPSLVEAMGAGCAIIAHDNEFNHWVAGDDQLYFNSKESLNELFDKYFLDENVKDRMKQSSKIRFHENFEWHIILDEYEKLLCKYI